MDKEEVEFHISVDDYFGTLATVISLCAQDLKAGRSTLEEISEKLLLKSEELRHLQEHYRIARRE